VERARQQYGMTERHACQLLEQWRGTQRYAPIQRNDEDVFDPSYRHLGHEARTLRRPVDHGAVAKCGWQVGKDRAQCIWRRKGLKVPAKQ
jgi:putative transposase